MVFFGGWFGGKDEVGRYGEVIGISRSTMFTVKIINQLTMTRVNGGLATPTNMDPKVGGEAAGEGGELVGMKLREVAAEGLAVVCPALGPLVRVVVGAPLEGTELGGARCPAPECAR